MAADVYLQLTGITGESSDATHKGWIECQSMHWGVSQPRSSSHSSSGGHTTERCDMSEVSISKLADLASPMLFQVCASGRTIPKAKIEFLRADGNDDRIKYFEIELENVIISHCAPGINTGEFLRENFGLRFSQIKCKYTQQKVGGGSAGNAVGGWNLASNRVA